MTQNNSTEQHSSLSQSLYKELEGLKIRIAFAKIEEEEESLKAPSSVADHKYDEIAQHRTIRIIHQEFDKKSRRYFVRKTLPRALQVFAGVVLLFFLSLTAATATSHAVRVKVLTFIINMEDTYTELSLENIDDDFFEVPIEWKGTYYMSYIPDGFNLDEIDANINAAYFYSIDGRQLEFRESSENNYVNIDTETSIINEAYIHGSKGLIIVKNNTVNISWSQDNHFFVIRYDGSIEEAQRIAENVRMIR